MKFRIKACLVWVLIIFCPILSYSASFDCTKAVSKVEQLICSDKNLSDLDNQLSELYKAAKTNQPSVVNEQKQWLLNERNKCESTTCLKNAYQSRIHAFTNSLCSVSQQSLIGSWIRVKGDTTFEEMNFSIIDGQHSFLSWIHHRPEMSGEWEFDNCTVHIHDPNQENVRPYLLKVNKVEKGKLYLFDTDARAEVVYKFAR